MSAEYTLLYWPGFAGRGEFVRLMFAVAGVPFNDPVITNPSETVPKIMGLKSGAGAYRTKLSDPGFRISSSMLYAHM